MDIQNNLINFKRKLPKNITLVAVSKTKSVDDIMKVYLTGQRIFGENKVQEMVHKYEEMPKDVEWHMIGHLQTNKVKFIAPFVSLIHGVDSLKLLEEINKQAKKNNRILNCLLQIYIAKEDTKFGLNKEELICLIRSETFKEMKNIKIIGLMGMASFTENKGQIKAEFLYLKSIFDELSFVNNLDIIKMQILSMGMSNDYVQAIACGSTMIRIGNTIFGVK